MWFDWWHGITSESTKSIGRLDQGIPWKESFTESKDGYTSLGIGVTRKI